LQNFAALYNLKALAQQNVIIYFGPAFVYIIILNKLGMVDKIMFDRIIPGYSFNC